MQDSYPDGQESLSTRAQTTMISRTQAARQAELNMLSGNRLNDALSHTFKDLSPIVKNESEGNRGKYADLAVIVEHCAGVLLRYDIRWRFGVERTYNADEGSGGKTRMMTMYCDLIHMPSGEVERTIYEVPIPRLDPQGMASAFTYGRRYALLGALGFATSDDPADDDGERAMPHDLSTEIRVSKLFIEMTAEISKIKEATELVSWKMSDKQKSRFNKLEPTELERLRSVYKDRERELVEASQ